MSDVSIGERVAVISGGAAFAALSAVLCFIIYADYQHYTAEAVRKANAAYYPGEIVKSRILNFRGIVTGTDCYYDPCRYSVRFYGASGESIEVQDFEIAPSK